MTLQVSCWKNKQTVQCGDCSMSSGLTRQSCRPITESLYMAHDKCPTGCHLPTMTKWGVEGVFYVCVCLYLWMYLCLSACVCVQRSLVRQTSALRRCSVLCRRSAVLECCTTRWRRHWVCRPRTSWSQHSEHWTRLVEVVDLTWNDRQFTRNYLDNPVVLIIHQALCVWSIKSTWICLSVTSYRSHVCTETTHRHWESTLRPNYKNILWFLVW